MTPPAGLTARPATTGDAQAIHRLIAACEHDLDGRAEVDLDDIVSDLARPGMDLMQDTVLLHAGDRLVGWAQVMFKGVRAEADVAPAQRGRGIGTWLLDWTEARSRAIGADRLGQMVTDNNTAAATLFLARGYAVQDTAWILEIFLEAPPAIGPLPDGITLRAYAPGVDDVVAHALIDEAFCEWPGRDPVAFSDWAAAVVRRETFAPALSALAFDGSRLVGAALALDYGNEDEGYVQQLAVRRDYRHRGIARALLFHVFGGFHRTGRRWCTLSTNSYTGALSLYERVGMRIRQSYTRYERPL